MDKGDIDFSVPQEICDLVGSAMTPEALRFWWETPLQVFNNRRPLDAWFGNEDAGTRDDVINFIKSAKSGDMN